MFNQIPQKIVQTNRLPFLIGIIVFMLVIFVFMYKSQMNQKKEMVQSKPHQSIDVSAKSMAANWFNDSKFKNIRINHNPIMPKPTPREIEAKLMSKQALDLKKQEIDDEYAARLEIKKMEDKNRIEDKKLELKAMKAPLSIDVPSTPGSQAITQGKPTRQDQLTDGLNHVIDMVNAVTGARIPSAQTLGKGLADDINNQDEKHSFLKSISHEDDYLENSKTKPRSPYEIKAGSYISAALITGINSDLPGNVNAQVTQNVYDSITGNYLLIPQGARLVGEYNSNLTYGQNRVQVVWNRIIFPDGQNLNIQKMQGADISGYTGFHDKVDNHFFRVYANAVLLSLVGSGYDILNRDQQQQSTDARSIVAANVGQKLSDVSGQTLEKNMNVQPTLVINPGYKFKIFVMKDMVLENIDDAKGALAYSE
jgi:type IV secretion system protein VirB10